MEWYRPLCGRKRHFARFRNQIVTLQMEELEKHS